MSALLPCPFCGASPHQNLGKVRHCQLHGEPIQDFILKCPHGCAHQTHGSREAAIAAWNQRATPAEIAALRAEVARMKSAASTINEEVCQTLGKALGYPWFKDDPVNFPDSTEAHGVCVGDHVAESIAAEAAKRIEELRAKVERLREALERIANHPEANVVLTDYGPDGKQRVWPTVEQEARAALAKEPGHG